MTFKKTTICLILLILVGLLLSPVCFASRGEITDVERHVPESFTSGETTEITLSLTGEKPFVVGIVETIPQGFTFPENDRNVSGSKYFKLDRDTGKISFAVNDENEVTYNVIPSSNAGVSFEGYWADMLFQTPELNVGKESWISVTDPHAVSSAQAPGAASDTEAGDGGTGLWFPLGLIAVIACLIIVYKKYFSGGNKR